MGDPVDDVRPTIGPEDCIPGISSTPAPPPNGDKSWPKIKGYEIKKWLGKGGEGHVYQALEQGARREVAIKVVNDDLINSENVRTRFFRQLELTAKLEEPRIARLYQYDTEPYYFIVMELIRGVALDEFVKTANLNRAENLELFCEICEAVFYAHQMGVVHLDLKPANILVDKNGVPHILDFGLARALSEDAKWEYVKREGTPTHMSPEQAKCTLNPVNANRSDIYSLGVLLYTLLLKRFPHDVHGSNTDVMQRIATQPIYRPREIDSKLPRELAAILDKSLQHDPAKRYDTAAALTQDVKNYLNNDPVQAVPNTTPYVLRKWFWKHRNGLTLTATGLFLSSAFGFMSYRKIAHERHVAELREAEVLVSQGDLLGQAGKWNQAKESYQQAHQLFFQEGASPLTADIGTWKAFRHAPPVLSVIRAAGGVMDAALTPDGRQLVTASQDGRLRVWNALDGHLIIPPIQVSNEMILSVCVAPTGSLALAGACDSTATLVDLSTGKVVTKIHLTDGWITRVAMSASATRALVVCKKDGDSLTSDEDDQLYSCSLPDGMVRATAKANGQVVCAAFSPDGSKIVTGGGELAFWDATTLRKLHSATGIGRILSLAFSSDGNQVAIGGSDGFLRLLDVARGQQILAVRTDTSAVNAVAFSRDGQTLISTGNDGISQVWITSTGSEQASLLLSSDMVQHGSDSAAMASTLCADGNVAMRLTHDDVLNFFLVAPPVEVRRIPIADQINCQVHFLPGAPLLLTASSDGLRLWDIPTGQALTLPALPIAAADATALTGDGRRLAVLSASSLSLLDTTTWKILAKRQLDRRGNSPALLAFAPDGRELITAGPKLTLSLWDGRSLAETGRLVGNTAPVTVAAFSPDSTKIISAGRDRVVRVWDAATGRLIREMAGHQDTINAVVFSPDGRFVFSGGGNSDIESGHDDFVIRQWDIDSGQCIASFAGHQARVRALAINPEGTILASASDDKTLMLWEIKDNKALATLNGHTDSVVALGFAPDGQSIISAGEDRQILYWNLGAPSRRDDLKNSPGELFAFLGLDNWAADSLRAAQAHGERISHLTLARCFWRLGQMDQAIAEMNKAQVAHEGPDDYLALCVGTISHQK
jgi:WD40 repeat protein/serine/threonine protein kinase